MNDGKQGKAPRKPAGEVGFTRITFGNAEAEFIRIPFPESKSEIEALIVEKFISFWKKQIRQEINVSQNPEDDLDYTLHFPSGDVLLELTEIVFPNPEVGSPYKSTKTTMSAREFADRCLETISKKIYPKNGTPKHLLCYITHWSFSPSDTAIKLVQYELRKIEHSFENIFLLQPFSSEESWVNCFFPVPDELLQGFDPISAKESQRIVLDPKNAVVVGAKKPAMERASMIKNTSFKLSDDGKEVTIVLDDDNGTTTTLDIPFEALDSLFNNLLVISNLAFEKQVAAGNLARVNPLDAAMIPEAFRVLPQSKEKHVLVQLFGRADPNAPIGLGSFKIKIEDAEMLANKLTEVVEKLRKE